MAEKDLRAALLVVLDQVDYTRDACAVTEMVGAVLPREVIDKARAALAMPDTVPVLRAALVGLVGVDTPSELHEMRSFLAAVPRDDQAATVAAVSALLEIR